MTTATPARSFEKYAADFKAFTQGLDGGSPDWLASLRQAAWAEFKRVGFPTARRGNEPWKYTDLRQLDREPFAFVAPGRAGRVTAQTLQKEAPWSSDWHTAVLVDGHFSPELSSNLSEDGLSITTIAEAAAAQPDTIKLLLGSIARTEGNAFVALNTAFLHTGVFVQIVANAELEHPIHILSVTTNGEEGRAVYPRILLSAGANARATIIETHLNLSDSAQFVAPVFELSLGNGAGLRHFRVQLENEQSVHVATTRTYQPNDAVFNSTTFATGPGLGRNAVHTLLAEQGAETTLHGLYITNHRSHQDNEISTTHEKPHGTSHQYYKGILAGKSRAVFSGKVWVRPGAMKTVAQQKDLNLLLSHGAEIDTMPSLEILADDVKCAHGATAGHVDRDMLFYLESRGVDHETAVAMLITGFASEIIDEFEPEQVRDFLYQKLEEIIPQLESEGIL